MLAHLGLQAKFRQPHLRDGGPEESPPIPILKMHIESRLEALDTTGRLC